MGLARSFAFAACMAFPSTAVCDGGDVIGYTPADPARAEAPRVVNYVEGPWWQDGVTPRWLFEASVASGVRSTGLLTSVGTQLDIGGVGAVGFRYARPLGHHRAIRWDSNWIPALMLLTVGLIALPVDSWLGNEQGLDLRIRGNGSPDATYERWALSVGIAPIFRISANRSRARFPSIVGALLPEVGVTFGERHTAAYFDWSLFPFGVMLVPHLGLELNIGPGVSVPFDGSPVRFSVGIRIGIVLH